MNPNSPTCNLCGTSDWGDFAGRIGIKCNKCYSLERTRLQFLHLQKLGLPKPGMKVLHVAPEIGMAQAFRAAENIEYDPVDYYPDIYRSIKARHFDLCVDAPKLESECYDIIIHNHVLEHIFCDVTSVVLHLQRALKREGYHIFSLPFFQDRYYEECLGPLSEQEAHRRFGQKDHCRQFSVNSLDNTFGMYLKRDFRDFIPSKFFQPDELESINFPRRSWEVVDGSTTIILRKGDTHFPT